MDVLRQAAAEARAADRFSKNPNIDIDVTMKTARDCDVSEKLRGYIHYNSITPFKVHIIKEELFRYYKKERPNLHLDATGSLVRKIDQRDVFCYALVAADRQGSFPLAVMLSISHTTVSITHFLQHVNAEYKKLTKTDFMPPALITDLS